MYYVYIYISFLVVTAGHPSCATTSRPAHTYGRHFPEPNEAEQARFFSHPLPCIIMPPPYYNSRLARDPSAPHSPHPIFWLTGIVGITRPSENVPEEVSGLLICTIIRTIHTYIILLCRYLTRHVYDVNRSIFHGHFSPQARRDHMLCCI